MDLKSFAPDAAPQISTWAQTADEVLAWCSRFEAPVPADVIAAWSTPDDIEAFLLEENDDVVAYGELWVDDEEEEVELARLIVDPEHRGRGVGRQFVAELAELALQRYPLAVMRVHPDNAAAQRSYAAAGFERVSDAEEAEWNQGQPLAYVWMVRRSALVSD